MAVSRTVGGLLVIFALVFAIFSPAFAADGPSPAPAPLLTSDGTSIDQTIAYVLMLLALVLTYLIHPLDASSPFSFF